MSDQEVLEEEATSEESEEEVIEELPEASEEEEQYTVTLKDGTKKKFKEDVFNEILEAHDKGTKWETKYHKKGERLNKKESEIVEREKALKGIAPYVAEWKRVKAKAERDPRYASLLSEASADAKASLDPAFKELAERQAELEETVALKEAIVDLRDKYKGFSYDDVKDFVGEFDDEKVKDRVELIYLAMLGSQIDNIKTEAQAEVVRKAKGKKGLPSTGKVVGTPPKEPLSDAEAAERAHNLVRQRGERWR
jgi:hypothetical protein